MRNIQETIEKYVAEYCQEFDYSGIQVDYLKELLHLFYIMGTKDGMDEGYENVIKIIKGKHE